MKILLNNQHFTWLFKCAFWFCIAVILMLSTTKGSGDMPTLGWDKFNHCFAFFVLFVLIDLAYAWSVSTKIIFLIVFAVGIECIQYFLPSREFSLLDVVADLVGMGLYLLVRKPLFTFNLSLINKISKP